MKAKNRKEKLYRRRADYDRMMASSDPTGRKVSGGYHKPGSNKK